LAKANAVHFSGLLLNDANPATAIFMTPIGKARIPYKLGQK